MNHTSAKKLGENTGTTVGIRTPDQHLGVVGLKLRTRQTHDYLRSPAMQMSALRDQLRSVEQAVHGELCLISGPWSRRIENLTAFGCCTYTPEL